MNSFYTFLSNMFAPILKYVPASILNRVGADKVEHFAAGTVISLVSIPLVLHFGFPAISMLGSAVVAGGAKELLDYVSNLINKSADVKHDVSIYDALATSLGGVIPFIIAYNL